jgi:peptidase E
MNQARTHDLSRFQGIFGGGGWANRPREFLPQVKAALKMTLIRCGIQPPHVLVIPSPLDPEDLPCNELKQLKQLFKSKALRHVQFSSLMGDTQDLPKSGKAKRLLKSADLVIVLGGNFPETMYRWRISGLDRLMREAAMDESKIFTGASTGLCWPFIAAQTIERQFGQLPSTRHHLVQGLGILPAYVCPHYSERQTTSGIARAESFYQMMRYQPIGSVGIGVDTHAALRFSGQNVAVVGNDRYASVQHLARTARGVVRTKLRLGTQLPLDDFFNPHLRELMRSA